MLCALQAFALTIIKSSVSKLNFHFIPLSIPLPFLIFFHYALRGIIYGAYTEEEKLFSLVSQAPGLRNPAVEELARPGTPPNTIRVINHGVVALVKM